MKIIKLKEILVLADSGVWGEEGSLNIDFPVLRSTNIIDFKLNLQDTAWRKLSGKDLNSKVLKDGDIIVTKSSGSPELIGKCCLFTQPQDKCKYYFSNFMLRLRPNQDLAEPKWIYYWLISESGRQILKRINNTTSGLRNLNIKLYLEQTIPLPPLSEQKRIVAIFDKADTVRRKRQETIRLLDEFLRSVFLEMFGDFLNGKIKCEKKSIKAIARFIDYRGKTPIKSDSGIRLITAKNVKKGYISDEPKEYIPEDQYENWMTRGYPKENDILFTTEAPLGNVAKLGKFEKVVVGQRIIALQCFDQIMPDYLMYALLSDEIQNEIYKRSTGSTAVGIRAKELEKIFIPVPSFTLQQKFSCFVENINKQKLLMEKSLSETENSINSLMQKAFRGEL